MGAHPAPFTTIPMPPSHDPVQSTLVRIHAHAWGLAIGSILSLGLFAATNVLVVRGGEHVGDHLGRLGLVFPGYDVSFGGSLIGAVYCFVIGYGAGRFVARARGGDALPSDAATTSSEVHPPVRARAWGLGLGLALGLTLAFGTALLVVRGGENVGPMMEHLRLYLPGYTVSSTGAVLGGVQLGIVGYLMGHLVAVLYNRICKRMTRAEA